jgi:hypothetical protein
VLSTISHNIEWISDPVCRSKCRCLDIEWGVTTDDGSSNLQNQFDLVVGSDVIYCKEVVLPLLLCVKACMAIAGAFWMCSSFKYSVETEREIDRVCHELLLCREIESCRLEDGGVRLQVFRNKT